MEANLRANANMLALDLHLPLWCRSLSLASGRTRPLAVGGLCYASRLAALMLRARFDRPLKMVMGPLETRIGRVLWTVSKTTEVCTMAKNNLLVTFSMRVSGGSLPAGFAAIVPVEMDFNGCDDITVRQLASRSLRIDLQRVLRTKTPEYLNELARTGLKINWRDAGRDIRTRDDKIAELVAAGMPERLAVLSIDDPTRFAELMAAL